MCENLHNNEGKYPHTQFSSHKAIAYVVVVFSMLLLSSSPLSTPNIRIHLMAGTHSASTLVWWQLEEFLSQQPSGTELSLSCDCILVTSARTILELIPKDKQTMALSGDRQAGTMWHAVPMCSPCFPVILEQFEHIPVLLFVNVFIPSFPPLYKHAAAILVYIQIL